MNKHSFKLISSESGNYIVTLAIGEKYYKNWEKYAQKTWVEYCNKNNIGLIIIVNSLDSSYKFRKMQWQKFLIPKHILTNYPEVLNICYLDTDILISPIAPNVFLQLEVDSIGLISARKNLPYPYYETMLRVSWFRHSISKGLYPLDSNIFASIADLYTLSGLPIKDDYACSGVFLLNIRFFALAIENIYVTYSSDVKTITDGGEQTHLNYEFQNRFKIKWLDYKFQAIWLYEVANFYPSLFWPSNRRNSARNIEDSLLNNYFLHFSGSWPESSLWKNSKIFNSSKKIQNYVAYTKSLFVKRNGTPVGKILPKKTILQKLKFR